MTPRRSETIFNILHQSQLLCHILCFVLFSGGCGIGYVYSRDVPDIGLYPVPAGYHMKLVTPPTQQSGCPSQTSTVSKLLSAHSDGVVGTTQLSVCLTALTSISGIR